MKRKTLITVLLAALTLALSLCVFTACGGNKDSSSADLPDIEYIKILPGESGLESDSLGAVAASQYVRKGNPDGIDLAELVLKGEYKDGNEWKTINLTKDMYDVSVGDLDFDRIGMYNVRFTLKSEKEDPCSTEFTIYVGYNTTLNVKVLQGHGAVRVNDEEELVTKSKDFTMERPDDQQILTAVPDDGYALEGFFKVVNGIIDKLNPLSKELEYKFNSEGDDLSVVAMFIPSPSGATLDIEPVYQLRVAAGESGFVTYEPDSLGKVWINQIQFIEKGDTTKDLNKLEIYGFYRKNKNEFDYIRFNESCYTIDYDGFDINKTGHYIVVITSVNSEKASILINIYVYEKDNSLSVSAILNGNGSFVDDVYVTPNGYNKSGFNPGDEVTLEVKADEGYEFAGWYYNTVEGINGNTFVSAEAKHTFTIGAENLSLIAYFREKLDVSKISKIKYSAGDSGLADIQAKLVTTYDVELNEKFEKKMKLVRVAAITTDQKVIELLYGIDYILEADVEFDNTHVDTSVQGYYHFNYIPKFEGFESLTIKVNVHDYRTITIDSSDYDMGTAADAGGRKEVSVNNGSSVRIVATPNEGYKFVKWVYYVDNTEVALSTEADYVFELTEDMSVYAVFEVRE